MKLYHGSTTAVKSPDIRRGRNATDFGKGFYTTTDFIQAKKWAILKKKRESATQAVVSVFEVPDGIFSLGYQILHFSGATEEWLNFVVNNRKGIETEKYDLIMGSVANDQLYATIRLYEQQVISAEAAIGMLKTHKLFNQLSFHSAAAIKQIQFVEAIPV